MIKVKSAYIAKRRQLQPYYRGNDDHDAMFEKCASLCKQLNADPNLFIEAQFHNMHKFPKNFVYPSMLYSKLAIKNFQEYIQNNLISEEDSYKVQLQYLRNQLKMGRTLEQILMDDSIDLDAWFRIIISKESIQKVYNKYLEQARKQITSKLKKFLEDKKLDVARITE